MRINSLLLFGVVSTALVVYAACRKVDMPAVKEKEETLKQKEERFFGTHTSPNVHIQALTGFMKRENDKLSFVNKTVSQIGYPLWDKALIFSNSNHGAGGRGNSGDTAQIAYIPFVRDSQNFVNASLIIKTTSSDTIYRYLCDWQYQELGFDTTSTTNWNGYDVFLVFATLDKSVFNRNKFVIKDSNLLHPDIRSHMAVSGLRFDSMTFTYQLTPVQASGRGNNYWDIETVCYQLTACYYNGTGYTRGNYSRGADLSACPANSYFVTWTECYNVWVWVVTGGGTGEDNGGDNGSGTSGGGSGSGSGGSTPPECQPTAVKGMNANPDCEPGWQPVPDPPPAPTPEPIDSILSKYSRKFRHIGDSVYNNHSLPGNKEYFLAGARNNTTNDTAILNIRTDNDSSFVQPNISTPGHTLLFIWHSHVSASSNPADRRTFSPADIDYLRRPACLKTNFASFADCGNKQYAIVITDPAKAAIFFNTNNYDMLDINYTTTGGGSMQEVDERCVRNILGNASVSGISFYVSANSPQFTNWTLLNQ